MSNEEARDIIKQIEDYLTAGNPIWDVEKIHEACQIAIKALDARESYTRYLNINVTKEEIKRNPDIVRLVAEDGECIEYTKVVN